MNIQSNAGTLKPAKSFSGLWSTLACILMGGLFLATFALNPRLGVGILTLIVSFALLSIRFEAVIYGILAFTVVFVDGWLPTRSGDDVPFRLGIGRLYLMEIPILLLFLAYLIRRWSAKRRGGFEGTFAPTPLDSPLRAWVVALPVFALYGLFLGHPLQDAAGYYEWRCLFISILFYFLVTSLFRENRDLLLLWRWFFILASAKSLYSLILVITNIDPPLPLVFGQGPIGEGPENVMYLFTALPALAILLFRVEKEPKWRRMLQFGTLTMVANVALCQKRDPQIALLIGLVLLVWHLPRHEKIRWSLRIACVVILVALGGALANRGSGDSGIAASLSRYGAILEFVRTPDLSNAEGDTFTFHVLDIVDGWEKVKERPLFGQGFGGQTERNLTLLPTTGGENVETGLIHNQYLTFWLKMGIAGPILFLWLVGRFLNLCHQSVRGVPQTYGLAITLGISGAMWADLAMEFWTAGWIANTKTPITIFLALAIAVGFLRESKLRAVRVSNTNSILRGYPLLPNSVRQS